MDDLLNRAHLVVPSTRKYNPVTLPYGYRAMQPVESVDTADLDRIVNDTREFISALEHKHDRRIEAFKTWADQVEIREREKQRKLAPGYLDSREHLLQPTKYASGASARPLGEENTVASDTTAQPTMPETMPAPEL